MQVNESLPLPEEGSERVCGPRLPPGFIDLHCHLLYGMDDGPKTLEISAEMCAVAHADGTAAVVATPHANHLFRFDRERTAAGCARLEQHISKPLRVFAGCEVELSVEALPAVFRNPGCYTLNGSRYLLLELMPSGMCPNIERVFSQLLDRGITPIIAHPERNAQLQLRVDKMLAWIQRGCLIQLTGDSVAGRLGSRVHAAAMELLRHRLVHFIASDAHDPIRRPPRLLAAYRKVYQMLSPQLADLLLVHNPMAVLEDRPIRACPAF